MDVSRGLLCVSLLSLISVNPRIPKQIRILLSVISTTLLFSLFLLSYLSIFHYL